MAGLLIVRLRAATEHVFRVEGRERLRTDKSTGRRPDGDPPGETRCKLASSAGGNAGRDVVRGADEEGERQWVSK